MDWLRRQKPLLVVFRSVPISRWFSASVEYQLSLLILSSWHPQSFINSRDLKRLDDVWCHVQLWWRRVLYRQPVPIPRRHLIGFNSHVNPVIIWTIEIIKINQPNDEWRSVDPECSSWGWLWTQRVTSQFGTFYQLYGLLFLHYSLKMYIYRCLVEVISWK